ncbi:MAG: hypothetical protein WAM14_09255 [Candidatus Nitrosopolaris sp.]
MTIRSVQDLIKNKNLLAGMKKMNDDNDIPEIATIREEYVRCGNPACQKCNIDGHGNNQGIVL